MKSRGSLELAGGTWWLRIPRREVDPATGATRIRRPRVRLGRDADIRSRVAARRLADLWLARANAETLSPEPGTPALEYLEHFLAVHVPLMRPTTQRRYRATIRNQLSPVFADRALHEISPVVLQTMIADLTPHLARATIRHVRAVALQVLRRARRDGFLTQTFDTREIRLPSQHTADREQRSIGDAELALILAESELPWRLLWGVMGFAGLRVGEALGLRWADVDFDHGVLLIRQNAVEGRIHPPKTRGSQSFVPIVAPLGDLLREWRALVPANPLNLVFATRRGTAISSDSIRRWRLRPLLERLGIPQAGCHAFRHGAASRLEKAGCSPDIVRRILRHSDLKTTTRYLHVDQTMLASAVELAGERFTALCKTAQNGPSTPNAGNGAA